MDAQQLAAALQGLQGFKALLPSLFGGRARRSYALYHSAAEKGVFANEVLRREASNDKHFAVMVFCAHGPLAAKQRESLQQKVNALKVGLIRYEAMAYEELRLWRGEPGSFTDIHREICELAFGMPGVYLYPVVGAPAALECPLVVFAKAGEKEYIYPVPQKSLQRLAGGRR